MFDARIFFILLLGMLGCSRPTPTVTASRAVPTASMASLPVTMTVKQRSTTPIPGLDNKYSITVGDITRGQVMVSAHYSGESDRAITGLVSLKQGESTRLEVQKSTYHIRLVELNNALVGEDFATFEISSVDHNKLTEEQKIEKLITGVASLKDARFIRNGTEYSASEAAEHLRYKLKNAGDSIKTAAQFIEHIASKSSTTGDVYLIRLADGRNMNAEEFFKLELSKLEP